MGQRRQYVRQFFAYKDYFKDFKRTLTKDARDKLYAVLLLIMTIEDILVKYFKSIKEVKGLYEIRVEESGNIYRIFCCFDDGNLVILFNGFQKKTQKTPSEQIAKAERIMNEYFNDKKKNGGK